MSFRFSDQFQEAHPNVQQKWVQTLLRARGWIVPSYELAPDLENIEILRVVVRENVSAVLIDRLVTDIVGFFLRSGPQYVVLMLPLIKIELVEGIANASTPLHALAELSLGVQSVEKTHGKLEKGSGSQYNGTYAKPC